MFVLIFNDHLRPLFSVPTLCRYDYAENFTTIFKAIRIKVKMLMLYTVQSCPKFVSVRLLSNRPPVAFSYDGTCFTVSTFSGATTDQGRPPVCCCWLLHAFKNQLLHDEWGRGGVGQSWRATRYP